MTGHDWLERVFERGLRIGEPGSQTELLGGLRALVACGVLSEEAAANAESRLNERFDQQSRSRPRRFGAPGSHAKPANERLEAILTPGCALADVDGITVALVTVELWTSKLFVRLGVLQNSRTDELDARYETEMSQWLAAGRQSTRPPWEPGALLAELPLSVSDDAGTNFYSHHRSSGGSGTEWRSEWRFEPAVPSDATRLTIAVEGDSERYASELALPSR